MEFRLCRDIEDYVDFALQRFETIQKREEIISFLQRVQAESPKRICEIGTYNGGTNFVFYHALHSVNMMIGIDLYVQNRFLLRFFSQHRKKLYFINGASCNPTTLGKVESLLDGHKIDLLFIDGDHSYDGVSEDFVKYRSYVRRGGLIAFHDINPSNFLRNGVETASYVGGVPTFWAKIKLVYPFYEFISDPNQDGCGIGLIKYFPEIDVPEICI
jgi:predicted O-methyltransferase YrrM